MESAWKAFDVSGRVAVVTGGAGVLGSVIARGLGEAGAKVCILDLDEAGAAEVADAITRDGGEAMVAAASVLDREALEKVRDAVLDRWGRIDILLNAAGGNMAEATLRPDGTFFNLPVEAFDSTVRLNLIGTVLPTQIFGEVMAAQKKGAIVNVSSMTAMRAISRVVAYSAAKAGVENFTRWMAVELATRFSPELRVNAIAPGFFVGRQNRDLLLDADGSLTERGRRIIEHTPMGRFGEPEDLVGTVIWLCSDASKFVTGVVVPIDGGFSIFSGI
jgi:NAD(P)-dependent dehydrogenase (short-subunit alcohol dehydrogenase family)